MAGMQNYQNCAAHEGIELKLALLFPAHRYFTVDIDVGNILLPSLYEVGSVRSLLSCFAAGHQMTRN